MPQQDLIYKIGVITVRTLRTRSYLFSTNWISILNELHLLLYKICYPSPWRHPTQKKKKVLLIIDIWTETLVFLGTKKKKKDMDFFPLISKTGALWSVVAGFGLVSIRLVIRTGIVLIYCMLNRSSISSSNGRRHFDLSGSSFCFLLLQHA